jgi:hypothetical protein
MFVSLNLAASPGAFLVEGVIVWVKCRMRVLELSPDKEPRRSCNQRG